MFSFFQKKKSFDKKVVYSTVEIIMNIYRVFDSI